MKIRMGVFGKSHEIEWIVADDSVIETDNGREETIQFYSYSEACTFVIEQAYIYRKTKGYIFIK